MPVPLDAHSYLPTALASEDLIGDALGERGAACDAAGFPFADQDGVEHSPSRINDLGCQLDC